jgi:hypothetical protein
MGIKTYDPKKGYFIIREPVPVEHNEEQEKTENNVQPKKTSPGTKKKNKGGKV